MACETTLFCWQSCTDKVCLAGSSVIKQMEMILANFFWGKKEDKHKSHWIKWSELCFPTSEGGAGFRSIEDFCNAFAAKMWWTFRTHKSMLSQALNAKYCSRDYPVSKSLRYGQSHTWTRMMKIKDGVEPLILRKVGPRGCLIRNGAFS